MLYYTGGRWVVCIQIGNFYVVLFDSSSPCHLLCSPGTSDVLIKLDLHICKTEEKTAMHFKKLAHPNVTLMKLGMRA